MYECTDGLNCSVIPESSSTLLVHLGPGGNSIDRHEEHFPGLNNAKEHFQVVKNVSKYLLLRNTEVNVLIIRVGTLMDDTVHI